MPVSAVIVVYKSSAVIEACLQALAGVDEIVVVDNHADDALARRPGIRYIRNAQNVGYGRGNNIGVAAAQHDLILLVNPDAVLEPDALPALLLALDVYPEAGLLMPEILTPEGKVEASHDAGLFHKRSMPRKRGDPEPEGDLCADFLSGAVQLIRRSAFEAIGGFDPNIFMYFDDDDLCLRLRRAGYALVRVKAAKARHVGGGSSTPSPEVQRLKDWNFAWSRLYLEHKFNGAAAAWSQGLPLLLRRYAKGLLYTITGNRQKAARDLAQASGHFAYLCGKPAQPKS
jgi:N-acetylglucosaminyl-diphospho-decaprenol L-rhamnosyltransferase